MLALLGDKAINGAVTDTRMALRKRPSDSNEVTVERLESAIKVTARCMVEHDLPQLLPTLKRLEAERDRLVQEGDAIEYARRLLVVLAET